MSKATYRSVIKNIVYFLFATSLSSIAQAENITDKLIGKVIEKELPQLLYEEKDKRWDHGIYSIQVRKNGASRFTSNESELAITLPIKVNLSGSIKKNVFGARVSIGCDSDFTTKGHITVSPRGSDNIETSVAIDIPIPNTSLDCDGIKLPITTLLIALVDKNKIEWQDAIQNKIDTLLAKVGI